MSKTAIPTRGALQAVLTEAALGKRVAIAFPGPRSAKTALDALIDPALDMDPSCISRVNGNRRINFENGGSIRVLAANTTEAHGVVADLLYVHAETTDEQLQVLKPIIATSIEPIVRFE
nr:hypothetical protein [Glutamicibacter sp. ZJUTW]